MHFLRLLPDSIHLLELAGKAGLFVCLIWGHTRRCPGLSSGSDLRNHSWLWGARDQTRVGPGQGKYPLSCAMAPASKLGRVVNPGTLTRVCVCLDKPHTWSLWAPGPLWHEAMTTAAGKWWAKFHDCWGHVRALIPPPPPPTHTSSAVPPPGASGLLRNAHCLSSPGYSSAVFPWEMENIPA